MLALVLTFQTSAKLAFAYGMAVTGTITITTILFFFIVRHRWRRPLWLAAARGERVFLVGRPRLLRANLTKITHGAWLPLAIGVVLFIVMTTWYRGRRVGHAERLRVEGPLQAFIDEVRAKEPPVSRASGTGVFMNRGRETAPLSMRASRRPPPLAQRARAHPLAGDRAGAAHS